MKTNITLACAAAITLASVPALAGSLALTDDQLDAVSGKGNTSFVGNSDNTTVTGNTAVNGNVQVGYYQWSDDHTSDQSINKAGNIQSGDNSMVQQNGTAIVNILAWGGASQAVTNNTASIGSSQGVESWWIMYLGGF